MPLPVGADRVTATPALLVRVGRALLALTASEKARLRLTPLLARVMLLRVGGVVSPPPAEYSIAPISKAVAAGRLAPR